MVREAAFVASPSCPSILRSERKTALQPPESDPPASGQDARLEQSLKDLLASDLASLTLGQLLGMVLPGVSLGKRRAHLRDHDSELANGFFQRNVNVGSVPAPVRVPRTHSGAFRPQVLPASLSVDNRAVKGPSAGIRPPSAHGPSAIRGWPAGPDPTGSAPSGYCRMTEARIGRQRGGTGAADRQEDAVASAAVADCLDSPAIPASGQPDRNRPLEVRRMCSSTLVDCGAAVTDAARAAPDRTDATRGQPAPSE